MNPEPSAGTPFLRTRRHRRRDLEIRMQRPHARLIHAKDSEILWLHLRRVGLVRDREGAAAQVVDTCGVELGERLAILSGGEAEVR